VSRELAIAAAFLFGVRVALAQPAASPRALEPDPPAASRAAETGRDAWKDRERWERLRRGMSRFDVFRILGEPGKVASYDGFERWEYPDLLGGRVNFDDEGAVVGWRLPPEPRPTAVTTGR
jgi:hypothetical protein